ncbi:hypothetical protein [Ligilactobacillus equi]|uniref:Uncharacterized protein n=2 Tax=Ligilactobacillus equi TaxID=137357 RepID=V7HW99_9LACO|nr:hypothetical protein [Ligilactobacillus equi]ETA74519.1 hypothetical protein LEQ_0384 [Ligilactobacillus equi DPC 6820]KRL84304.1 hypothetical protein FC36_GL000227 [Ligilactobacillus equi DSM 15833 = JCM 10991]
MNPTLYELKGMKAKNSLLKSIFITGLSTDGYQHVEVEPYDDTGFDALNGTPSRYDKAQALIKKEVSKYFKDKNVKENTVLVTVYSERYGVDEHYLHVDDGKYEFEYPIRLK